MKLRNIGKSVPKGERAVRNTGAKSELDTLERMLEYEAFGNVQGDGVDPWDDPDWGLVVMLDEGTL